MNLTSSKTFLETFACFSERFQNSNRSQLFLADTSHKVDDLNQASVFVQLFRSVLVRNSAISSSDSRELFREFFEFEFTSKEVVISYWGNMPSCRLYITYIFQNW